MCKGIFNIQGWKTLFAKCAKLWKEVCKIVEESLQKCKNKFNGLNSLPIFRQVIFTNINSYCIIDMRLPKVRWKIKW